MGEGLSDCQHPSKMILSIYGGRKLMNSVTSFFVVVSGNTPLCASRGCPLKMIASQPAYTDWTAEVAVGTLPRYHRATTGKLCTAFRNHQLFDPFGVQNLFMGIHVSWTGEQQLQRNPSACHRSGEFRVKWQCHAPHAWLGGYCFKAVITHTTQPGVVVMRCHTAAEQEKQTGNIAGLLSLPTSYLPIVAIVTEFPVYRATSFIIASIVMDPLIYIYRYI